MGATVPGVTVEKQPQYLLELCWAVAKGQLPADKFAVGVRAAGLQVPGEEVSALVSDTIW